VSTSFPANPCTGTSTAARDGMHSELPVSLRRAIWRVSWVLRFLPSTDVYQRRDVPIGQRCVDPAESTARMGGIVNIGMKISELLTGKLKPIRRPKPLRRLRPLRGVGIQQPRKLSFPRPPNRP
jgi:hypothetical protein